MPGSWIPVLRPRMDGWILLRPEALSRKGLGTLTTYDSSASPKVSQFCDLHSTCAKLSTCRPRALGLNTPRLASFRCSIPQISGRRRLPGEVGNWKANGRVKLKGLHAFCPSKTDPSRDPPLSPKPILGPTRDLRFVGPNVGGPCVSRVTDDRHLTEKDLR
jgi:hypothetical protein